jgi:hypothetical protein
MGTLAAIFAALPAFLQSLPYLAKIVLQFMTAAISLVAWARQKENQSWLIELESTINAVIKSKTAEEKLESARRLSVLVSRL